MDDILLNTNYLRIFFSYFLKLGLVLTGWIHFGLSHMSKPIRALTLWELEPFTCVWPRMSWRKLSLCLELNTPNLWLLHFNVARRSRCKTNGIDFYSNRANALSRCLVPVKVTKSRWQRIPSFTMRFSMNIGCSVTRCKYVLFFCWRFTSVLLRFYFFTCMMRFPKRRKHKTKRFDCIQIGARHPVSR